MVSVWFAPPDDGVCHLRHSPGFRRLYSGTAGGLSVCGSFSLSAGTDGRIPRQNIRRLFSCFPCHNAGSSFLCRPSHLPLCKRSCSGRRCASHLLSGARQQCTPSSFRGGAGCDPPQAFGSAVGGGFTGMYSFPFQPLSGQLRFPFCRGGSRPAVGFSLGVGGAVTRPPGHRF